MKTFLALLFFSGVALSAFAHTPDELDRTITACGKPVRIKALPAPRGEQARAIRKDVYFNSIDMMFMRDGMGQWTQVGAFRIGNNDTIDKEEAVKLMPCLDQIVYSNKIFERPAAPASTKTSNPDSAAGVVGVAGLGMAFIICIFGFYFLPAVVAVLRGMDKTAGVVVLNIFLGWTLIGWVVALCWAISGETSRQAQQRAAMMAHMLNAYQPPSPPPS